jgi:hypothetical protein
MKRWLMLVSLVLVLGLAAWGYHWWNSSSSTSVVYTPETNRDVLGTQTTLRSWHTAYFATSYPSNLRVRTTNENSAATIIGSYMLSSVAAREQDQIGITIANMGNTTLTQESAVKFRLQHPERYTSVSRNYAPSGAYVFNDESGYETGVFWQTGDRFAAVVVSGSSARRAELESDLEAIVSNWQWL